MLHGTPHVERGELKQILYPRHRIVPDGGPCVHRIIDQRRTMPQQHPVPNEDAFATHRPMSNNARPPVPNEDAFRPGKNGIHRAGRRDIRTCVVLSLLSIIAPACGFSLLVSSDDLAVKSAPIPPHLSANYRRREARAPPVPRPVEGTSSKG
jgi:hypothetical protein